MPEAGSSIARIVCLALGSLALAACQREESSGSPIEQVAASPATDPVKEGPASSLARSSQLRYSLGIVGYNYTETGIIDYSVNGTGAFNLAVSTEHSGGGKTVCCFGWAPGMKLPIPVHIEWTRGNDRWCRKTVMLTDPGALEPTTFEVHFYPDRRIEVAITDKYSPPRLALSRAGRDYRIAKDLRKEEADAVQKDSRAADCREGRFPIGEPEPEGRVKQ